MLPWPLIPVTALASNGNLTHTDLLDHCIRQSTGIRNPGADGTPVSRTLPRPFLKQLDANYCHRKRGEEVFSDEDD